MHSKENPTSLIFNTEDTWKYHAELLAIENTMNFFGHVISLTFRRLLEVWYIRKFRNFGL